ncbi:HNH endonuclease [Candidatus Dependentiae bacterium]|nr:MAG: HNH endonuclease [Candidatus Dependentiae bacterium]
MEGTKTFIDKYGSRRQAVEVRCLRCEAPFVTRTDQVSKYCSAKCSHQARKRQVETACAYCGATVLRSPSKMKNSRSGFVFCDRACKERAQRERTVKQILPPHYGTGTGEFEYRSIFLKAGGVLKCVRCGYDEFSCGIEVHHKDKNRKNNSIQNLVSLCANCHRGLHAGKWQL